MILAFSANDIIRSVQQDDLEREKTRLVEEKAKRLALRKEAQLQDLNTKMNASELLHKLIGEAFEDADAFKVGEGKADEPPKKTPVGSFPAPPTSGDPVKS